MHRTSADVLLTQEVKLPEGEPSDAAEQAARNAKRKLSTEPCLVAAKGGRSAGTAVATRNYIGMSMPKAVEASQSLHARGHFAMRRVAAMGKGSIHCGSAYMFSGVGIAAKCSLDLLDTMAFTLSGLVGPWIIGGEWNCTPAELEATGWIKKVGGIGHAPQAATCNGKVCVFVRSSCCHLAERARRLPHWGCWTHAALASKAGVQGQTQDGHGEAA